LANQIRLFDLSAEIKYHERMKHCFSEIEGHGIAVKIGELQQRTVEYVYPNLDLIRGNEDSIAMHSYGSGPLNQTKLSTLKLLQLQVFL
jgi:hypothetical protein